MNSNEKYNSFKQYYSKLFKNKPIRNSFLIATIIALFVILLDVTDFPSTIIQEWTSRLRYIVLIGGIFLLVLLFLINQSTIDSFFKIRTTHGLDVHIFNTQIVCLLLIFYWQYFDSAVSLKCLLTKVWLIIATVASIVRVYICFNQQNNIMKQLYDLKDIYENTLQVNGKEPILLSERDVDYDLLNRDDIIDLLYRIITTYKSDASYVIGLEGEWGSGKTTIINIVKQKIQSSDSKKIIVDDLDSWSIGSSDVLIETLYEKILNSTGIAYSPIKNNQIIKSLQKLLSSAGENITNASGLEDLLANTLFKDDFAEALRDELEAYLISQRKTIVLFIDNLDRVDADNIVSLFKMISTLFNLPNIVYVLSYDKTRMENILESGKEIHSKFIEKIVQMEIRIPKPSKEKIKSIYTICLRNVLDYYNSQIEENSNYEVYIDTLCNCFDDLRTFKRYINSVLPPIFMSKIHLDEFTMLSLETIRFFDYELYKEIVNNPYYFVSHDKLVDQMIYSVSSNRDEFNNRGKQFFERILNKHENFKHILSVIFPYVLCFSHSYDLIDSNFHTYKGNINSKYPIYSAKYFSIYFNKSDNDYAIVRSEVIDLIKSINQSEDYETMLAVLVNAFKNKHYTWKGEMLESIQLLFNEIDSKKYLCLARVIWTLIPKFETHLLFFASPQERATIILSVIFDYLDDNSLATFCDEIKNDYTKLLILYQLVEFSRSNQSVIDHINPIYDQMCNHVITSTVDLYDEKNYYRKNIYGLLYNLNDEEKISEYLSSVVKDSNVYKYLGDCIGESSGNSYGYFILNKPIKYFDVGKIDIALSNHQPQNECQDLLYKVYRKFKDHPNVEETRLERRIELSHPVSFDL